MPKISPANQTPDVRFGSKADIARCRSMSALPPKADIRQRSDLMKRQSSIVALVRAPSLLLPFRLPTGAPRQARPSSVGALRQLRTDSVQGAVRIHESELSHSVISVANLTETTLDSATGPFRSDGIGIRNV
jgi:hypothetical protein